MGRKGSVGGVAIPEGTIEAGFMGVVLVGLMRSEVVSEVVELERVGEGG